MTQNLETADTIVKLILAVGIIALKVAGALTGPFATPLAVLAVIVIVLTIVQRIPRSRHR